MEASVKRQVLKHNQQPAREIEVTGIKLPKKFSSVCRNNHETWQPALFLEEPDDPQKVCHYAKSVVYPPNLGAEFSPEEIKARRSKYKMNELNRNSEQQRRSREEDQTHHQPVHDHCEKDSKSSGSQNQQYVNSQMQEIGTIKKETSKYQQQQQQHQHQYYVQHQQMPVHNINNNNMYYEQQQNHEAQTQYQQEQHQQPSIQNQSNQQQYHINHYDQERYSQKLNSRQHEQLQHCYKDYESESGDPEEDEDEDDNDNDHDNGNDNDNQDTEDEQVYGQKHSHQNHRHQIHHQYHPQSTSNQQNMKSLDAEGDLEDQIEASTIRFSMHTPNKGSQNKTLKIKFKKERPQTGSDTTNGNNYSAYTIERIYQTEVKFI